MLVQCNAPAVLAPLLAHDSERLVLVSLECLRNISDVPTDGNRFDLLRALLRLFGHRNQKVTRYTLDILANLCANNKVNKVSNEGVFHARTVPKVAHQNHSPPITESATKVGARAAVRLARLHLKGQGKGDLSRTFGKHEEIYQ
ncbi:hypothetical protein TELCIR_06934 [Teladorsagia circumcincta]|uniref:Armadillo repeat-containing domain-containing protein n=1 Tax=Teladorsagia circumcincta TaxID=45464 RepID=A0A2G9ULR3_TELCI|nr:hypothetical protein TELCIR_06934 [Teladorsagia circumcincta]